MVEHVSGRCGFCAEGAAGLRLCRSWAWGVCGHLLSVQEGFERSSKLGRTRSSAKSVVKYSSAVSAGGNKLEFSLMQLKLRFPAVRVWGDHVLSPVSYSQIWLGGN